MPTMPVSDWTGLRTGWRIWWRICATRSIDFLKMRGVAVNEPMPAGAMVTLTQAVEELADQVERLRGDLGRRTRRLWRWVLGAVAVGAVALTVVIVYLVGAVADIRRNEQASCVAFASVGRPDLLSERSSDLAREIVETHAVAAREMGCSE